jgi:hypothetical protein
MARKTSDPQHVELKSVLESMLESDHDVTAREVVRRHSSLKNASDVTRHVERRAIFEAYLAKQNELRQFAGRVKQSGPAIAAKKLQATEERIRELERNEESRIASHLAMITAVCELGGTAKLLKFYHQYARIRDSLANQGALPHRLTLADEAIAKKQ